MKIEHIIVGAMALQQATAQYRPDSSVIDDKFELGDVVFWGCTIGALTFIGCCVTFCLYILCKKKPEPYTARNNHTITGTTSSESFSFHSIKTEPPSYEEAVASLEFR